MLNLVTDTFGKEEKKAIRAVVKSGYYTYGKQTIKFEKIISKKFKKNIAFFVILVLAQTFLRLILYFIRKKIH